MFNSSRKAFVVNEAIAIYMFGVFASLAIVFRPMLLSLNSNLALLVEEDSFVVFQGVFYLMLFKFVLVALVLYLVLFFICIFMFSKLTFSTNEMKDIMNNNRRSAIILCGLLISIFYACSQVFDVIFSSIIESPGNEIIF